MKLRMKTALGWLAAGCAVALCLVATGATAQAYPTRPIRLIVPFGAGGGSDYVGRLVGVKLTEQMGQQVVVDNRPGAASLVGTEIAMRAAPDGYTLLLADAGFTINIAYYKKAKYDALKDFDPVTVVGEAPYLLVVHPALPYSGSLKDYVAAAKAQPGRINLGSAGNGSGTHFSGELFKLRAGLTITHVPYKSAGASVADVVGGQIQSTMTSPPPALSLAKAGRLKILAQATAKRTALLADIPTFEEGGVPGVYVTNWYSVMSVGGTPKPVLKRLHDELIRAIAAPDTRERLAAGALEPAPTTPEQFRRKIEGELTRWAAVVRDAGIKQE
ncbi:MAG: Bug family tripartite tricarboxylate transporter substrate binding protein [Burkholderiales bacterium]